MTGNQFKYGYVDISWILNRNTFAIAARNETYSHSDIVKMTIQSTAKWLREFISVDKLVFFKDTWDPDLKGYFRTAMTRELGGDYKGTRVYMTPELLEEMKASPDVTPEEIKKAEKELYLNQMKNKAKWALVGGDLGKVLGIETIAVQGWEFDDLATLASHTLGAELKEGDKPSVIITKDSDLLYSTSPGCALWIPPLGQKPSRLVTYEQACAEYLPPQFHGRLSLYKYKAMADSTGAVGHNDMSRTVIPGIDVNTAIEKILTGDTSVLTNPELFKKQYETFNIWNFPRLEEARRHITENLPVIGRIGSIPEFHTFCDKNGISGISDRYFTEFVGRFDSKLFSGR